MRSSHREFIPCFCLSLTSSLLSTFFLLLFSIYKVSLATLSPLHGDVIWAHDLLLEVWLLGSLVRFCLAVYFLCFFFLWRPIDLNFCFPNLLCKFGGARPLFPFTLSLFHHHQVSLARASERQSLADALALGHSTL